jgi:LysM repeat protein
MFGRLLGVALVAVVLWGVVAHSSSGSPGERAYVVQRGDTLWSIAAGSYGGDPRAAVWRIRQRNGLEGSSISPGQRLVLP